MKIGSGRVLAIVAMLGFLGVANALASETPKPGGTLTSDW
jgi:hypothetical protein